MTAHESQGISIHCLCRNNKSEKNTITKVKFKRGTTKTRRSCLQLHLFLAERVKSTDCKIITIQYTGSSKGKNFRKTVRVWRGSF